MSLLSNLLKNLVKEAENAINQTENKPDTPATAAPAYTEPSCSDPDGYYDSIPAEENQYNSGLNYIEYFRKVFAEDFPGYVVTEENVEPGRRYVYTFNKDGAIALVVEVMTEKSSVQKLRNSCKSAGVPYTRFYFDHYGWWNARSYVVERVRRALG